MFSHLKRITTLKETHHIATTMQKMADITKKFPVFGDVTRLRQYLMVKMDNVKLVTRPLVKDLETKRIM